jgi:hypothetical protein
MRLDPPPKRTTRVHELARELGWPPNQLVDELNRRGEFVRSAMSTIEAPVVRAIRREFAAVRPEADPEELLQADLYGDSAASEPTETFAEALARIKSEPPYHGSATGYPMPWRPPVLQALLDEVILQRPERVGQPSGGHFHWEFKKAQKQHLNWTKARFNGLGGDDFTVIKWIRLSGGERPQLAAELSNAGIAPDEAGLQLGYGGRTDPRMDTLFVRFRDRRISRSELITAVRQWRANNSAG